MDFLYSGNYYHFMNRLLLITGMPQRQGSVCPEFWNLTGLFHQGCLPLWGREGVTLIKRKKSGKFRQ
jgi:hypothetical protein